MIGTDEETEAHSSKEIVQCHTAGKQQSWDVNRGSLATEFNSVNFKIIYECLIYTTSFSQNYVALHCLKGHLLTTFMMTL